MTDKLHLDDLQDCCFAGVNSDFRKVISVPSVRRKWVSIHCGKWRRLSTLGWHSRVGKAERGN